MERERKRKAKEARKKTGNEHYEMNQPKKHSCPQSCDPFG